LQMQLFPIKARCRFGDIHQRNDAVDIETEAGAEVYACVSGMVKYGRLDMFGYTATIKGTDGRSYYYANLFSTSKRTKVVAGDVIGILGKDAGSDRAYLHFSICDINIGVSKYGGGLDPKDDLIKVMPATAKFKTIPINHQLKSNKFWPCEWGETVTGTVTNFIPDSPKEACLSIDLCGRQKNSYDRRIFKFIEDNNIVATVFASGDWIKGNHEFLVELLRKGAHIEIENHGYKHLPATYFGKRAYGMIGPVSKTWLRREVNANQQLIEKIFGVQPKFYRPGGMFCDEKAVDYIDKQLGLSTIGYSVLGDAGTTYTALQAETEIKGAKTGDIIIVHGNRPNRESGEGVVLGLNDLLSRGYKFVRLSQRKLVKVGDNNPNKMTERA
jgi:peptidoglycan/xylan/chitin deacetylase (PgdA/CDA1 family)